MDSSIKPELGTREQLIITAERLFAQRGIHAVSLRAIGTAAGQRNSSVTQYHFGDKATLLDAIFDYRMTSINEQRMSHLATMRADGRGDELRSLIEAFLLPLAASVAKPGSYYARFLATFSADPRYQTSWDWKTAESLRLVWGGLRRCLSHLPESTVQARLRMLEHLVLHTIADHERAGELGDCGHREPRVTELVDAAEGLLTAPTAG